MVNRDIDQPSQGKTSVQRRSEQTAKVISTAIWQETASKNNPYLAESCRCHGYDILELMQSCRYVDVLYLLFRGELPDARSAEMFEQLHIAVMNPGVRHPAVRACCNAATSRSDASNILPIGLSVLGGEHLGAAEVEQSMRFLQSSCGSNVDQIMEQYFLSKADKRPAEGDCHPVPGFGSHFGSIEPMACQYAQALTNLRGAGRYLKWGSQLVDAMLPYNFAWLMPGLVAACLLDLGFNPRAGAGLYQMLSAPGLLAHALEYAHKPFNSLPFADDSQYRVETNDECV